MNILISILMIFTIIDISRCNDGLDMKIKPVGKAVFDVDAGSDDAIAMIMGLQSERLGEGIKVLAITCVHGNTWLDNVYSNVLKTLKVVDRLDIPVYKGTRYPLIVPNRTDNYFGNDGFGDFDYPNPPSTDQIREKHASIALIDIVNKYPGEVTIVALGPLTNIAMAIRIDPQFLNKVQQLIIMGGSTAGRGNAGPGIEFNFRADPHANYIVLKESTKNPAILVPVETVETIPVPMAFRIGLNKFKNKKVWLINNAETVSLKPDEEFWYCADGATMAVALTGGKIITESGYFRSDGIYDGETSGMIVVDYTNITQTKPNIHLTQRLDTNLWKKLLVRYFS